MDGQPDNGRLSDPVKVGEWRVLCERERARGGEVIALALTNPSAQEMAADVLLSQGIGSGPAALSRTAQASSPLTRNRPSLTTAR